MTSDKGILIKNIYYMLAYAFQVLKQSDYQQVASEEFENIYDLFSAILYKGISRQLKQGLYREYVEKNENLSTVRGKIDINGTILNKLNRKQRLACEFDELSENNIFNSILKTTALVLIGERTVKKENRQALRKIMPFFDNIDGMDPVSIKWNTLNYKRNNQNYKMLMNICYFILDSLLQTPRKGESKLGSFSDEKMAKLFEKFVLEYYRFNHAYLSEVSAAQIKWDISEASDESDFYLLPMMQTDIALRNNDKTLIIDTKYYTNTMQSNYNKQTIHSGNLYQIYTYVKNKDVNNTGNVSGMVLYAKTSESITPDCSFIMGKNIISVKTLDLNRDFNEISMQLDDIVMSHFGVA